LLLETTFTGKPEVKRTNSSSPSSKVSSSKVMVFVAEDAPEGIVTTLVVSKV
jgi:hypothetical protein